MAKDGNRRRTVHFVATPGGHLDLLLALRPAFEDYDRVWIVSPGASAEALRDDGEAVLTIPRWHGLSLRSAARSWPGLRLAWRQRPRVIVTAGSGNVVPFCLASRAFGARLLFVETMARITDASQAGRALARVADHVVVQWPDMLRQYPRATVCRPVLLDGVVERSGPPRTSGVGTLVAVGTHIDPFDRMLRMVDTAVRNGVLPAPGVAQVGVCSYEPASLRTTRWMTPDELDRLVRDSRYFICHAGSGLISRALKSDIRPMVVARRADLGEHVDDHQRQLTDRLGRYGLVVPVEDEITPRHLEDVDRPRRPVSELDVLPRMHEALPALVDRALARQGARKGPRGA